MSGENREPQETSGEIVPAKLAKGVCPACAKPLREDADRCDNCGIALGEHQRCVHCRAIVDVDVAPEARFVCRICGGVRIPIDDASITRSPAQIELLKRATIARSATTVWTIVSIVVAAFGVSSVLVLVLVVSVANPGTASIAAAGLAAMVPFVFAALAFRKSRVHHAEIARLVEAAWMAAATDIARAHGVIESAVFAKLTRASIESADQLLGRMSSQSLLTSSVTPEGSLTYTLSDVDGDAPRAIASRH